MAIDDLNAQGRDDRRQEGQLGAAGRGRRQRSEAGHGGRRKSWSTPASLAVVGHLNSGTTVPASKIYNSAGIPQISPAATTPLYTHQGFKTAFRVVANDDLVGPRAGRLRRSTR